MAFAVEAPSSPEHETDEDGAADEQSPTQEGLWEEGEE